MSTLALKIIFTPMLICAASLAGRRWGEAVGGWLVGLPLTSGPVAFFLALDYGTEFARQSAGGSLAGVAAEAGFCVGYAWAAKRLRWPLAFAIGAVAFALTGGLLQWIAPGPLFMLLVAVLALLLGLRLIPRAHVPAPLEALPHWDIPARMIVATALVVVLTAAAPMVGPRVSGLLASFPVFAAVLTVFAHRMQGRAAAEQVLWGLLLGLFAFAGFFTVIEVSIGRAGIALAFVCAIVCAVAIQAVTLWAMRARWAPA
jgi:hypothetical protein